MSEVIRFPDNVLQRIEDDANNAERARLLMIRGYLFGACEIVGTDPLEYVLTYPNRIPDEYVPYVFHYSGRRMVQEELMTLAIKILGETAGKRANSRQESKPIINLTDHQHR